MPLFYSQKSDCFSLIKKIKRYLRDEPRKCWDYFLAFIVLLTDIQICHIYTYCGWHLDWTCQYLKSYFIDSFKDLFC